MLKRFAVYLFAAVILGAVCYWKGCTRHSSPQSNAPAVLKPEDKEIILIDPVKHDITIITEKGTQKRTLPDRPTSIKVRKGGDVIINSPQFGYQQRPFIGIGFSEKWRFIGGCDLLYFKRFDLGPALSFEPNQPLDSMRVNAVLSYTVWSNTRVGVAIDHTGKFAGFVTVRL